MKLRQNVCRSGATRRIISVGVLVFLAALGALTTMTYSESSISGADTNLTIRDSSDDFVVYANYTKFFVNYTNSSSGESINGSGVYCEWRHNKTGIWRDAVNMSFNATSALYELIADGGYIQNATETHRDGMPYGNYSWNVSCFDTLGGYADLSVADEIEVSLYSTALAIENGTDNPYTNQDVWFYANYTSVDFPVSGVGLDRYEIGQVIWETGDIYNVGWHG